MNEKLEQYIKDLSPELQAKARQCRDMNELQEFIAENDIEIPEDALEMVAGGGCGDSGCDHSYNVTERIDPVPMCGTSQQPISYNGKQVQWLETQKCSKCGETIYLVACFPSGIGGTYVVKSDLVSQAEYNSLKAQAQAQGYC